MQYKKITTVAISAALILLPLTITGCSGNSSDNSNNSSTQSNSNVISELNLPEPGEYGVESNSWTTISNGIGGQEQVHIIHATDGNTYVIPYADTAMVTVSAEQGTLVVAEDEPAEVADESAPDRGEEQKKYRLMVPAKDWDGRMQRGNGQYSR